MLAGLFEVAGPAGQITIDFNSGYGFTAIIVAFLGRLHPVGILLAGLLMALTYIGGELAQLMLGLPGASIQLFQGMLLFFLLATDVFTNFRVRIGRDGGRLMDLAAINPVLLVASIMVSATPILLAAIGEMVVEKSGVLNLGVEGMMITGAVVGFAVAVSTGCPALGLRRRGAGVGAAVAQLRRADADPAVEPGGDGARPDAGRAGAVGADRQALRGHQVARRWPGSTSPTARDMPVLGRMLFSHDPWSICRSLLVLAVWAFLKFTRAGLILRAVGEIHDAAHALGYKVVRIRLLAIFFGGACAGLGGAYLSLVRVPQWTEGMTAGAGWIALAIVVFASWRRGPRAGRCLSFRRRHRAAAQPAGRGRQGAGRDLVDVALSDNHSRAGRHIGARAHMARRLRSAVLSTPRAEANTDH